MNIVEFAEDILGHELPDYQKEYLNTCYECILQNKQLYYIPSRGTTKCMPLTMQYIVLTYVIFIEHDLNKEESNMNDLEERYKTCGRCVHDGEDDPNIVGTTCYLCKRNPDDHRIDWFESKKEE